MALNCIAVFVLLQVVMRPVRRNVPFLSATKLHFLRKRCFTSLQNYTDNNRFVAIEAVTSGVASPKFWGDKKFFFWGKMFDFSRMTVFCFGYRLSKHKMTRYSKNLGGHGPLGPPGYAYGRNIDAAYVLVQKSR